MSLPNLPAGDKFRREVRTEWGGLNLNENAGDGELIEAMNMSSREFPVLSTERMNGGTFVDGIKRHPFIQGGKLGYIIRNGTNSYSLYDPTTGGGSAPIPLTDADIPNVEYAQMKDRMVIQPWNNIYDFSAHSASNIEVSMTLDNGAIFHDVQSGVTMQDFISDPLVYPWPEVPFSVGDAVTVSGFTVHPENNKTAVIRAIRDGVLYFDADTFDVTSYMYEVTGSALPAGEYSFWSPADGRQYTFTATAQIDVGKRIVYAGPGAESVAVVTGGTEYPLTAGGGGTLLTLTESYNGYHADEEITITRTAPEMEFVCVNENRVWGCRGDTIYASKLGDPLNWNVFDGLSTDSWTAETGTQGDFTGCCSFQGYPTFFKDGAVFKVLGDEPSNFTIRRQNIAGVAAGSSRSITEIHGLLYYVSPVGMVQWNGGDYPTIISRALGSSVGQETGYNGTIVPKHGEGAVGGTDGIRYFVYLPLHFGKTWIWLPDGTYSTVWTRTSRLFVYDPRFGTWHEIDDNATGDDPPEFARYGSISYMLGHGLRTDDQNNVIYQTAEYLLSVPTYPTAAKPAEWYVTFADSTRAYKTALTGSEAKKGVLRLLIRCRLAGSMKVWIAYDGGDFEEAGEFGGETGMAKGSRVVPLILRRCDFWQLRLTGTGDAVIYSIAVERYGGEWQQA